MRKPCIDCGTPTSSTRCPEHTSAQNKDKMRNRSHYGSEWTKTSKALRAGHPYCSIEGCTNTDLCADHITPRDESEIGVLCRSHNSQKSAEDKRKLQAAVLQKYRERL